MLSQKVFTVFFCMAGAVLVCLAPAMHRIVTSRGHDTPIVVNTWAFKDATEAAWAELASTDSASSALDAVEQVRREHQLESSSLRCHGSKGMAYLTRKRYFLAGLQHL